jgi:hypothetical protein
MDRYRRRSSRVLYSPEGLRNAASALRDFHERYPKHPGPPKNLQYWLRCAEKDIQPEARLDNNEPITTQRDLLRMQNWVEENLAIALPTRHPIPRPQNDTEDALNTLQGMCDPPRDARGVVVLCHSSSSQFQILDFRLRCLDYIIKSQCLSHVTDHHFSLNSEPGSGIQNAPPFT